MAKTTTPRPRRILRLKDPFGEIAGIEAGRDITRPWIGPLLQPQDRILNERAAGSFEFYRPIVTDPQVKSTFTQRIAAVVSREWEVLAGDESPAAARAADWLRDELGRLDWDRLTGKMMWGIFYGFAVAELIFRRDGALWGWEDIRVRDRVRFRFDADCGLRLITLRDMLTGEAMPAEKFWVFSTGADHDDEPYGLGLAHWLYWPVWFKKNGLRLWLIALDKFGMPTAKGTYHRGATAEEQKTLLDAVLSIQSEAGVIVPEGMDIGLLTAPAGQGSLSYKDLHDAMDAAIAKVILSQTMTTDDGSSLSQAEVHADVAAFIAKSDADLICGSFNRGPVATLAALNFPGVAPPKVWRKMEDPDDLDVLSARDKTLSEIGWQPTEERVREVYGEGYVRAAPAAPAPAPALSPGGTAQAAGGPQAFAEHAEGNAHGSAIDQLVRALIDEGHAEAAAAPAFADIAEALMAARTPAELRGRLAALETDPRGVAARLGPLADLLGRAALNARLAGELGAIVEDDEALDGDIP